MQKTYGLFLYNLSKSEYTVVNIQKNIHFYLKKNSFFVKILATAAQYPSQNCRFKEGPKNPLKGISMKPLVPALNAQFGVGAGREARNACLHIQGIFQWHGNHDPAYVEA